MDPASRLPLCLRHGDPGGLVEARLHHEIQRYSSRRLQGLHSSLGLRFGDVQAEICKDVFEFLWDFVKALECLLFSVFYQFIL